MYMHAGGLRNPPTFLPSYLPTFLPYMYATHTLLPSYLRTFVPSCPMRLISSYLPTFLPSYLRTFLPDAPMRFISSARFKASVIRVETLSFRSPPVCMYM